ncbi:MAG: nucleotidyltransferase family protein [Phycisphaerales bacterium]|nr:nucleotidyltransferase family protein [Phycisphaerales bacterium]
MTAHQFADGITVDRDQLAALCERHRITAVRIFGSALRADFGPESDLDMLVEFAPGVDPDLFELGGIQQDLSDLFGREVDLKTPEMFSPASLRHVLRSSRIGYAA